MSCPVQRLEDVSVAPQLSRDRATRGLPMFHDPVTNIRECDGISSKQRAVTMTMSCHTLDSSLRADGAHPHSRRTIQHRFGSQRTVEPHLTELTLRRPRPDFPRGDSRICSGAQDPRHDVRAVARNNLLSPSIVTRFTAPVHRDEASFATKRRQTTADHAHGRVLRSGSEAAYRNPGAIHGLCVNCRFVNVSRVLVTVL